MVKMMACLPGMRPDSQFAITVGAQGTGLFTLQCARLRVLALQSIFSPAWHAVLVRAILPRLGHACAAECLAGVMQWGGCA